MNSFKGTLYNAETKIWSGRKVEPIYNPNASLGKILYRNLQLNPNNIIQINHTENVEFTSQQVFLLSKRISISLIEKDISHSDVVGIIATNTSIVLPLCYGCLFIGAKIHPLDVHFNKESIMHFYSKTKPKIIFVEGEMFEVVKEALSEIKLNALVFTLNKHSKNIPCFEDFLSDKSFEEFEPFEIKDGNETAAIFCSSGTTGLPKAVCVSHRSLLENTLRFNDTVNDIILYFIPIYWGTSYLGILNAGISGNTRLVFNEDFTPELGLHIINKYQVTKIFLPAPLTIQMINSPEIRPMNSLTTIYCGGTRLAPETRKNLRKYLSESCQIQYGYGCTEIGTISISKTDENVNSNGFLCENIELKIVDIDGKNLGENENGEICVKTGIPWKGYYGDLKSTLEIYNPEDLWCRTGDLGHFDENGHLYVVDRIKDILKTRGFQFSATEVEDIIMEIPEVVETCVVGLFDEILVDVPGALVVAKENSKLSEKDVENFVAEKTPFYKHVNGRVFFVESIPKNSSGKVIRKKAREICENLYKNNKVK